jgi:hypothetical protein
MEPINCEECILLTVEKNKDIFNMKDAVPIKVQCEKCKLKDKKLTEININRMYDEGVNIVERIIKFLNPKKNNIEFKELSLREKKNLIKDHNEEFKLFAQIHPIVFEYLISEGVFFHKAFKKYIKLVWGVKKTPEEQKFISQKSSNVYYFKNKQYALYYKYILQEINNHLNLSQVNELYNDMVSNLDKETDKILSTLEKATSKYEDKDKKLTDDKRKELINLLKSNHLNS